jgi:hypothetical protein
MDEPNNEEVPLPQHYTQRARERKANAAVELRLAGATWDQIALTVGYPTAREALVAVERALEKHLGEQDREKLRDLAGFRLERLLRSVWGKAIDPDHPEHLTAATKAREIIDRHARLYGLDAPTEVVVHSPTQQEIERWVSQVVSHSLPEVEEYDIIDDGTLAVMA